MKKIVCALLSVCMIFGMMAFASCGKSKKDGKDKSSVDFTEDGAPVNPDWDL